MRPMSLYELRQAFQRSLALFYSDSLGSLQSAVKRLSSRGWVTVREERVGKRVKKVFSVRPAGAAAFFTELKAPIPPTKLEVTALARIHFLGLVESRKERGEVLRLIVEATRAALNELVQLQGQLESMQVPASHREVFRYQLKTLEYGIMAHRAGLAWFEALAAKP